MARHKSAVPKPVPEYDGEPVVLDISRAELDNLKRLIVWEAARGPDAQHYDRYLQAATNVAVSLLNKRAAAMVNIPGSSGAAFSGRNITGLINQNGGGFYEPVSHHARKRDVANLPLSAEENELADRALYRAFVNLKDNQHGAVFFEQKSVTKKRGTEFGYKENIVPVRRADGTYGNKDDVGHSYSRAYKGDPPVVIPAYSISPRTLQLLGSNATPYIAGLRQPMSVAQVRAIAQNILDGKYNPKVPDLDVRIIQGMMNTALGLKLKIDGQAGEKQTIPALRADGALDKVVALAETRNQRYAEALAKNATVVAQAEPAPPQFAQAKPTIVAQAQPPARAPAQAPPPKTAQLKDIKLPPNATRFTEMTGKTKDRVAPTKVAGLGPVQIPAEKHTKKAVKRRAYRYYYEGHKIAKRAPHSTKPAHHTYRSAIYDGLHDGRYIKVSWAPTLRPPV